MDEGWVGLDWVELGQDRRGRDGTEWNENGMEWEWEWEWECMHRYLSE